MPSSYLFLQMGTRASRGLPADLSTRTQSRSVALDAVARCLPRSLLTSRWHCANSRVCFLLEEREKVCFVGGAMASVVVKPRLPKLPMFRGVFLCQEREKSVFLQVASVVVKRVACPTVQMETMIRRGCQCLVCAGN